MAETTYYQSRHTGEEIDNLLDESIAATKAANEAAEKANTAVEDIPAIVAGKADLDPDTGYIPSSQISPLQGRQTGVNTSNGFFMSEDPALLFEGDRTHEICFTTGEDVSSVQYLATTINANGSGNNVNIYISSGYLKVYEGGTLSQLNAVEPNTLYHLVLSMDVTNQKADNYVNGVLINSISSFSDYQNPSIYLIGTLNKINSYAPFKGIIHYHRLFNYALTRDDASKLWNNANPMAYIIPKELITKPLAFPVSAYTESSGVFALNNDSYTTITPNLPQANGFSGSYMKIEAISTISVYCSYYLNYLKKSNHIKITMEYRSNTDIYEGTSSNMPGKLLATSNEGNAKVIDIYCTNSLGSSSLSIAGNNPDAWLEIRVLSIEAIGAVSEYMPWGLLPNKWCDTTGNKLDLTANNTPELSYETVSNQYEIVVDSGMFTTDIASGVAAKVLRIPNGYAVTNVSIFNANTGNLTGVSVTAVRTSLISNKTVTTDSPLLIVPAVSVDYNKIGNTLTVYATGNTPDGGMRVKVFCKWIGF